MKCSVVYHYFPAFRRDIFDSLRQNDQIEYEFVYGRNSRFGIQNIVDKRDLVSTNFFFAGLVLQSFSWKTVRRVCSGDSIILGDIKFLNSWLYAILCRLRGNKVYFWTHGLLETEGWLKTRVRRLYYALSHELFLYSANEQKLLESSGYRTPTTVIGNSNYLLDGLDMSVRTPYSTGCFYVGRITDDKRLTDFIDFVGQSPDRTFKIIGNGAAKAGLVEYSRKLDRANLEFLPATYDLADLKDKLRDCQNLIFFSPIGLSAFTAALLRKRIFVKAGLTHKPEYHLLKTYGLINEFQTLRDLRDLLNADVDWSDFHQSCDEFLHDNSAEAVACRISARVSERRN